MAERNPCDKNCPMRGPTCHSTCPAYIDWQQNHLKELERQREQKEVDAALAEMARRWEKRRR